MYVDVIACKRGRVRKVDVNLVRLSVRKAAPAVVSLPVRISPAAEEYPYYDLHTLSLSDEEPELNSADEYLGTPEEIEQMTAETMTAINEILAANEAEIASGDIETVVSGALDELDSMSRRTDDMIERLDDELAEALDEINDSTDENSEQLTSAINECLESVDNAIAQREAEKEAEAPEEEDPFDAVTVVPAAPEDEDPFDVAVEDAAAEGDKGAPAGENTNPYMRYFSRDEQGDKVEVANIEAGAQEVVCYDGVSGKVSRVCGIIKKEPDARYADGRDNERKKSDDKNEDEE